MAHTSLNKKRPKRNSPYMSEDEFKMLNQYYDIQCEPTSYHRKGVPLMRVKRISRGKPKVSQSFFAYVPASYVVPQAGNPMVFNHTQKSPTNKWFMRFNESTRNLNETLEKLQR